MAEILSIRSIECVGVPLYRSGLDLSAGNFAYLVASCYTPFDTDPVIYGAGWTMAEANFLNDGSTDYGRLVILTKANPTANETVGLCYGHAITGHIIVANLFDAGVAGLGGGLVIGGLGGGGATMNGAGDTTGATTNGSGSNPNGGLVPVDLLAVNPVGLIVMMTERDNTPTAAPSGWTNFKVQTSYHPDALTTAIATKAVTGLELDGDAAAFTASAGPWASTTMVMSG
jgi:hypothetical protein